MTTGQNTITLKRFEHLYSCITFTDLNQGDVVTLNDKDGSNYKIKYLYLGDNYYSLYDSDTRPTFTAGANGTVTVYGEIRHTISTMNYTITRGSTTKTGTLNLGSGPYTANRYTVSCGASVRVRVRVPSVITPCPSTLARVYILFKGCESAGKVPVPGSSLE